MADANKLWQALGTAIRKGATNKQIDHIVAQLNRARGAGQS